MNTEDMEKYRQNGGTYIVPTEVMNLFLDSFDNLNKGIDELIKKYEDKIKDQEELIKLGKIINVDFEDVSYDNELLKEIIQDLKKLKGE